ncbi:aminoglycoside phosphotransferase family protein [Arthrobacter sp. YAF17]|uniref:aminoglycoside phosphotransferase family protein n=1 Tax=Arthrobacter sp. YAF17 TaxID=3233077 RepID=UPI003F8DD160
MSQTADVPIPPDLSRRYCGSATGRDWLASLPRLIEQSLDRWQLELDLAPGELPWNGHGAIVVPVRHPAGAVAGSRTGEPAVLKIAYPHDEALVEPYALSLWNGHGAVRLLAHDAGAGALLLERLDADRSLQDAPMDVAVPVWAALVRRLSLVPDGQPDWAEFGHVAARAEQWSDELPETWERLGRPFPRWLLEAALEVCQTRGAVGRRSGKDVLVHTDLHYLNILARLPRDEPDPGGEPAGGWAAIDPQPMIGEAEFAVAPLLWNRIQELPRADPARGLRERCHDFSSAAGLDADVARQWSLAREVENALWYAAKPRHKGDLARSLWVASTLAGRTLPGLPAPHELPAPGDAAG